MMELATHILIFLVGLIALSKGADYFVEYSARMAKRLGVSDLVIGLTVTSIGTSLPELASSLSAATQKQSGLIIGNIIGSNIANIGLILGLAATIRPFSTDKKMHDRDGYVMIASVLLFFMFALNNTLGLWESIFFLVLYLSYILFIIHTEKKEKEGQFRHFMKFVFDFEYIAPLKKSLNRNSKKNNSSDLKEISEFHQFDKQELLKEGLVVIICCVSIVLGAKYLVQEAVWTAKAVGVPGSVIGLTMVSLGTSLPELLVSISAIRKNKGGIIVGNVIGSNIANLLLILGICGLILPLSISEITVTLMIPIMLFFSLILMIFIRSDWKLTRLQGIFIMIAYFLFIALTFIRGWSI